MAELQAEKRIILGKKLTALRKGGILPAVLYGEGVSSTALAVPMREFEKVLKEAGETSLVTLRVEGGKAYNVLIHDVATDPLTSKPIHADFYAVRMDKPIEAKVPLNFIGEPPAVKNEGGILVKVLHELEVKALPKDLPHEIAVGLAVLEHIGDKLHIRDLALPSGVSAEIPLEEVVALIEPPRAEAELEAVAKPEEAPVSEVKTEREVKAEEKAARGEAKGTEEGA